VFHSLIQQFGILDRTPDAHADDDFFQLGNRMHIIPPQLLFESWNNFISMFFKQPTDHDLVLILLKVTQKLTFGITSFRSTDISKGARTTLAKALLPPICSISQSNSHAATARITIQHAIRTVDRHLQLQPST
jgi:hypothetical protein